MICTMALSHSKSLKQSLNHLSGSQSMQGPMLFVGSLPHNHVLSCFLSICHVISVLVASSLPLCLYHRFYVLYPMLLLVFVPSLCEESMSLRYKLKSNVVLFETSWSVSCIISCLHHSDSPMVVQGKHLLLWSAPILLCLPKSSQSDKTKHYNYPSSASLQQFV